MVGAELVCDGDAQIGSRSHLCGVVKGRYPGAVARGSCEDLVRSARLVQRREAHVVVVVDQLGVQDEPARSARQCRCVLRGRRGADVLRGESWVATLGTADLPEAIRSVDGAISVTFLVRRGASHGSDGMKLATRIGSAITCSQNSVARPMG